MAYKVIKVDNITVAQGYKCPECKIIWPYYYTKCPMCKINIIEKEKKETTVSKLKKLLFLLFIFLNCQQYYIAQNDDQFEMAKKIIKDLDLKIVKIDTFWNLENNNILKYRITYCKKRNCDFGVDSLINNYFNE